MRGQRKAGATRVLALSPVSRSALALALVAVPVSAQQSAQSAPPHGAAVRIVPEAGPNAPRMDVAGNGTPIVRIATPSARGVSHNRYTDFNVDDRNLILNNSDKITQTQLGGWIDGNKSLKATGPATLILNEVVGANASSLAGYIEIAGAPAQLVIANPYGISCTGCGFLNSPVVTLAAARPRMDGAGGLGGFSVTDGTLDIGGQGLDASGARLDLFARAIAVNAGVWADAIHVAAGAAELATADGTITVTAPGTPAQPAPRFALDVAALGGMYAGAIQLIGTEAGLGVNVAGDLASLERGFSLDVNGKLTLSGRITSGGTIDIKAQEAEVTGAAYADGPLGLAVRGALTGDGIIASGSNLAVSAGTIDHAGAFAAGLARDGTLTRTGNLAIRATDSMMLSGQALATGAVGISGREIALAGLVQGGDVGLAAVDALDIAAAGRVVAAGALEADAATLVSRGILSGGNVGLRFGRFENIGGTVDARATLDLSGDWISLRDSVIQSHGAARIAAAGVASIGGAILALGSDGFEIDTSGAVSVTDTLIGSNGALDLRAGSLLLSGADGQLTAAGPLGVAAVDTLSVAGGARIAGSSGLSLSGASVSVEGGTIETAGALALDADTLAIGAAGSIKGATFAVATGELVNDGLLAAFGADGASVLAVTRTIDNRGEIVVDSAAFDLSAGTLSNAGTIAHAGSGALTVDADSLANAVGAKIAGNGALAVTASGFANAGDITAAGDARFTVSGSVSSTGLIASGNGLSLAAAQLSNAGTIEAAAALDLRASDIVNSGSILATGTDTLTLAATGPSTSSGGAVINGAGGVIGGNGAVKITGASVDLSNATTTALGTLDIVATAGDLRLAGPDTLAAASGNLSLAATGTIDASEASLRTDALAAIAADRFVLDGGLLQADAFALNAGTLSLRRARLRQTGTQDFVLTSSGSVDYSGGEIYAAGASFTLHAAEILNLGGAILHGGTGRLDIAAAGLLDNSAGVIGTNGSLALAAERLINAGGEITAAGAAHVAIAHALSNDTGLLASGDALTLRAGAVSNASGRIESAGDMTLDVASLMGGSLLAVAHEGISLSLTAQGAIEAVDVLGSSGTATLSAASISLAPGGRLTAGGHLAATATAGDIVLGGGVLDASSMSLNAASGSLRTGSGGLIASPGAISLKAPAIDLSGGVLQGASLDLVGGSLINAGGTIETPGTATFAFTGTIDNSGGDIRADSLTIAAASLVNARGTIGSAGTGVFALNLAEVPAGAPMGMGVPAGTLDNSAGVLASNGALDLAAGSLVNAGGRIETLGGGTLGLIEDFDNRSGALLSNGALALTAARLFNDAGTIDSLAGLDVTVSGILDNGAGTIVSRAGASAPAGSGLDLSATLGLTNAAGGTIASSGAFTLATQILDNQGALFADALSIDAGQISNGGSLSGRTLDLLAAVRIANNGAIEGDALSIEAGQTIANNGKIAAGVDGLALVTEALANQGELGAAGTVALTAFGIANSGTIASGSDLTIDAQTLTNTASGTLWAARDGRLALGQALTNRGSLGAAHALSITAPDLDNGSGADAGTIAAGTSLHLDVGTARLGKLVSGGDLGFALGGDWSLGEGESLSAAGTLSLDIGGNALNQGRLEGGRGVSISAGGDLTNAATGAIEGGVVDLAAGNAIVNLGLINGGEVTLAADRIENRAAIFGDTVSVTGRSGILNSGAQAVIAARGDLLDLRSDGTIANLDRALLYSLGHISIGGASGTRAASLTNGSSTIEAQGSISLAADTIVNERTRFAFGTVTQEDVRVPVDRSKIDVAPGSTLMGVRGVADVTETALIDDSGEARIIAGGDIVAVGNSFANRYSTIAAGGNFVFNGGSIASTQASGAAGGFTNEALTGTRTSVTTIKGEVKSCGAGACDTSSFEDGPVTTTETIVVAPGVVSAGGTVAITAPTIANVVTGSGGDANGYARSVSGAATGAVGTGASAQAVAGGDAGAVSGGLATDTVTGVAGVDLSGAALTVTGGQFALAGVVTGPGTLAGLKAEIIGGAPVLFLDLSGLFRFADPQASYLVETDPRFTNYGSFLSSDYFLNALGYDPRRTQKRLGDALYEQKLITDQLVAQAGIGRLAGYANNEEQYRALMDNGVLYARRFNLAPGIGLSAEQMATLTSDIVLLVEVTVQTPSGPQKLLAPRLYLASVGTRDLTSGGAVISGTNVALRAPDALVNSGLIHATQASDITGGDILNTGRLELGGVGSVHATNDLVNRGGTITGGNLTLSADRDLRLENATQTTRTATAWRDDRRHYGSATETSVTSIAGHVTTTGDLSMSSGRRLAVTGTDIDVGGNLAARGEDGISIASAIDSTSSTREGRDGKTRFSESASSTTNRLSTITVGGDASFTTPGAFSVKGAEIDARGALNADAGSIALEGVTDRASVTVDTLRKTSGLLSSKKTTTHYEASDETVVASTLSGDTVDLHGRDGVRVLSGNVVGTDDVRVASDQGDVTIGALAEHDHQASSVKVKQSGVSMSGGGLFAGVARTRHDETVDSTTHVGSLIGSATGDVTLAAPRGTVRVTGSDVVAPEGGVTIDAQSVVIEHATDTVDTTSLNTSSSFGLSVKLYENVSGAVKSVTGLPGRIGDGAAGGAAQTGVTAVSETLRTVDSVLNAVTNAAGISANLGYSKSKSTSESHAEFVSGSTVAAREVNVVANGSAAGAPAGSGASAGTLTVTGSDITATGDMLLDAGEIVLQSAQNSFESSSQSRSSGAGIGATVGVGLAGNVTASGSVSFSTSKGQSQASEISQVNTHVTADNILTIRSDGDMTLRGAVAEGRDVVADVDGNLAIESVQNISSRTSSSSGVSAGISFSPKPGQSAFGVNGGVSTGDGKGNSAGVAEQSALIARGGSADIDVAGATTLKGAVIAAVDEAGKDTGRLSLETGRLEVSDIADRGTSRDVSIDVSASVNDPSKGGLKGANTPTVDGSYASSTFVQETRGTVGQGTVAVGDPANSTPLAEINRDVSQSQVVTKDSQSAFTVYASDTAVNEIGALLSEKKDSVIVSTADKLIKDPLKAIRDVVAEIRSLGDGVSQSGALETLTGQLGQLLGAKPAYSATDAKLRARELAEQRFDATLKTFEKEMGRPASEDEKATLRRITGYVGGALAGIERTGMEDIDALSKDGAPGSSRSATGLNGELIVEAGTLSTGDQVVKAVGEAGRWLQSIPKEKREAVEKTLDVAFGGPVKAVGAWTVEYALQKTLEANPELAKEMSALIDEAGIRAIDTLSVDDEQTVREDSALDKRDVSDGNAQVTEIGAVFEAATTILGVDVPGLGKGKLSKLDAPLGKVVAQYGPLNQGPLSSDIVGTFRSGTYSEVITTSPTKLYRVIGDSGNPAGAYWTRMKPEGPLQSVIDSALDQSWGNSATRVIEMEVPPGTKLFEGAAAAQRGLIGGGNQIYFDKDINPLNLNWIK
ncbi:hemagglutinin repeat-containing protein [Sphingomonas cavernae]|uniref:Filamentous hemagglutinin N-terminal domain-containing protein n=1 Tax=Sphingomonas cavernae TaxID=2320861 RepID=A0A418WJQ6_9SPHN|nr:hemagglutinin repeat-containing protein [Sphingomonas cavernae]RJF90283.1 filamentous hemagglutinin N-terminal domain-containing protein [Sphingomonas cavernae]